jgi:hypothetical protein
MPTASRPFAEPRPAGPGSGLGTDAGGFISGTALLVLPALVLLAAATSVAIQTGETYLQRAGAYRRARGEARAVVIEVIELMQADATPGAHSRHDPLWRRRPPGVEITGVLPRGRCVPGLQCFSRYAYVNVNTAPVTLLETVAGARLPVGVASGPVLAPILAARRRGEMLTPASLRLALGAHHDALTPVLTAHALVNVNTAPPDVIADAIAVEAPAVDARSALRRILDAREREEILRGDLPALLSVEADARVLAFLGVRSSALRVLVSRGGRSFEAVLARIPDPAGTDGVQVLRFAEVQP